MTLLFRYLARNNTFLLLPTLALGIGLYLLTDLFERLDNFIEAGVSTQVVAIYFAVKVPLVISQILPVIFLLSTVIQLCLMARSRELTALQAGGISLAVVAKSMLVCGLFWGVVQLGFSEWLGVEGERESARIWKEDVRKRNLAATVLTNLWFADGPWIVSLDTLNPDSSGAGFTGYKLDDELQELETIVQATSYKAVPGAWTLENAQVYTPKDFLHSVEPVMELKLSQDPNTFRLVQNSKPQQLPLWLLGDTIDKLREAGSNVENLRTAWHVKLAYAASLLVMAMVAVALVSWNNNIYIASAMALVCTFLYYALFTLGTSLGERGVLSPFIAAWGANFVAATGASARLAPLFLPRLFESERRL